MKAKDIVRHTQSGRLGFITDIRKDLESNRVDVQFSYDLTNTESKDFKEIILSNQCCCSIEKLEIVAFYLEEVYY